VTGIDLRPVRPDDGAALHGVLSEPEVARWLRPAGKAGPFIRAECDQIVLGLVAHQAAHGFGTHLAWEGDRCIGWSRLGFTLAAGRPEVEIGWMLSEGRWGRGIGAWLGEQAADRALAHGVTTVVAFTRIDNPRSRRVMEKLAMRHERDFTHAGLPHVLYRRDAAT
jgi:RimJ/RimL family protein N-acetyltransferase